MNELHIKKVSSLIANRKVMSVMYKAKALHVNEVTVAILQ